MQPGGSALCPVIESPRRCDVDGTTGSQVGWLPEPHVRPGYSANPAATCGTQYAQVPVQFVNTRS